MCEQMKAGEIDEYRQTEEDEWVNGWETDARWMHVAVYASPTCGGGHSGVRVIRV